MDSRFGEIIIRTYLIINKDKTAFKEMGLVRGYDSMSLM